MTRARPAFSLLSEARTALSLLTVLPVRGPHRLDRTTMGRAMALAPLVGLVLGLLADVVVVAVRVATDPPTGPPQHLLPAVVGIAMLALLTRGLHLDGLADVGDALGARGDRDRALAVMRDSAIGAFGMLVVLFVVLIQIGALTTAIAAHRGTVALVTAAMAGRLAATLACVGVPAARPDGLGAMVAGTVRGRQAAVSTVVVLVLAFTAGLLEYDGGDLGRAVRAVIAACTGVAAGLVLRWYTVRRFGGITGDTLGATIEITTTVTLLMMAMTIPDPLLDALGID